jgi:hypothetical protein
VACFTLKYFSTLSHKQQDLQKKSYWAQNVFLFPLQLLAEIFVILRRTEGDMIKNVRGIHVKYLLLLSDINETLIFFDRFSKNTQISNFMVIPPVGAELFHVHRQRNGQT